MGAAFTHVRPDEVREVYADFCDSVLMPLMRLLDGEQAHEVAVWAASNGLAPKVCVFVCVSPIWRVPDMIKADCLSRNLPVLCWYLGEHGRASLLGMGRYRRDAKNRSTFDQCSAYQMLDFC